MSRTRRRSPEVRSTAFPARPPDLPPRPLMTMDFAITCPLVRPGRPRYPVFVHRAAGLLHASFRPHLAMTPLRFANPSPPSGWIEDCPPPSCRSCSAHRKKPRKSGAIRTSNQGCGVCRPPHGFLPSRSCQNCDATRYKVLAARCGDTHERRCTPRLSHARVAIAPAASLPAWRGYSVDLDWFLLASP